MIADILLPISYDWFLLASRVVLAGLLLVFLWRVVIVVARESMRIPGASGSFSLVLLGAADEPVRGFRLSRRRPVTIGRDSSNDIVLTDRSVSSHHAVIRQVGAEWVLSDLDSRNGTYVNGSLVRPESGVETGDIVQFGAVRLQLVSDETRIQPAS
jgi:pSer/pThr/pTyr-binding forkhead associated (FHA) protein